VLFRREAIGYYLRGDIDGVFTDLRKGWVFLRRVWFVLCVMLMAGIWVGCLENQAFAYAGFSRSYNFPCDFCHIQWPKLNDQGNFFKDRGFMLSTTGVANGLDMMFAQSTSRNYFPIGFHMSMAYEGSSLYGLGTPASSVTVGNGNTGLIAPLTLGGGGTASDGGWGNGANAKTPWEILSGGLISPDISFWAQPGVEGPVTGKGPLFEVQKLWVRFDALLGSTLMNVYVGMTSQDSPFSNQRALQIGVNSPYVMYDFQPGTPEVVTNSNNTVLGFGTAALAAYYDSDSFQMKNDHTSLRYFGYMFENGCGSEEAFSTDPCETRLSISLMPNSSLYGNSGNEISSSERAAGIPSSNNGIKAFLHLTQSFGGGGATNGERFGAFALVGQAASSASGLGGVSPDAVFNREGVDFSLNPLPDGILNIFGAWEIAEDPARTIIANPAIFNIPISAESGLEYLTWFVEADWQPTFHKFFAESGSNSNMVVFTYNQLSVVHQPIFTGIAQQLPENFDNVLAFDLTDRYWLWGSERTAISLFAEWQWMLNYGVGSVATRSGSGLQGYGTTLNAFGSGNFYNVEVNNFIVGLDFSY
jgi:hypothetical protein